MQTMWALNCLSPFQKIELWLYFSGDHCKFSNIQRHTLGIVCCVYSMQTFAAERATFLIVCSLWLLVDIYCCASSIINAFCFQSSLSQGKLEDRKPFMLLFDDVAIHYILSAAQWAQLILSVIPLYLFISLTVYGVEWFVCVWFQVSRWTGNM